MIYVIAVSGHRGRSLDIILWIGIRNPKFGCWSKLNAVLSVSVSVGLQYPLALVIQADRMCVYIHNIYKCFLKNYMKISRCLDNDVIRCKHFPRNWPFVRGIHRSRWIPHTRPVAQSFDVVFDLRLNKHLSKQPRGWWFETPSWSLWSHCNEFVTSIVVLITIHQLKLFGVVFAYP